MSEPICLNIQTRSNPTDLQCTYLQNQSLQQIESSTALSQSETSFYTNQYRSELMQDAFKTSTPANKLFSPITLPSSTDTSEADLLAAPLVGGLALFLGASIPVAIILGGAALLTGCTTKCVPPDDTTPLKQDILAGQKFCGQVMGEVHQDSEISDGAKVEVINKPDGATYDESTGQFCWTPPKDKKGSYPVTFRAHVLEDESCQSDTVINFNVVDQLTNCHETTSQPIDRDGDGFKSDVDCDDCDPTKQPLKENQVNVIDHNLTVCPKPEGYHNVGIEVAANDITIDGSGNIIDIDTPLQRPDGSLASSVINVEGFNDVIIKNIKANQKSSGSDIAFLRVKNSQGSGRDTDDDGVVDLIEKGVFENLEVHQEGCGGGVVVEGSKSNRFEKIKYYGMGSPLILDEQSSENMVSDNYYEFRHLADLSCVSEQPKMMVLGIRNFLNLNASGGFGLSIGANAIGNRITENRIRNIRIGEIQFQGMRVEGNTTTITDNTLLNCDIAIEVTAIANNNMIVSNTIVNDDSTGNNQCIVVDPTAEQNNTVADNEGCQ